jgi:hypothetical protein
MKRQSTKKSNKNNKYWATDTSVNCVATLEDLKDKYYKFLNDTGMLNLWAAVYTTYFKSTSMGPYGGSSGEWNEYQEVSINDFRNLIQHKVGLVINQKPSWEPMSVNSDVESLSQTKLARSLLEYYQDAKRMSVKATNWVLSAALYGEGYLLQTWDASVGALTFANEDEDGSIVSQHEGDIDQRVYEPIDVIRDVQIMDSEQNHWHMIREVRNRWDLAAKYPELGEEIENYPYEQDETQHYVHDPSWNTSADLVVLYRFFHKKTPSVPKGRMIEFLSEDIILRDADLPYEDYPLHRLIDTEIQGKNFAYTDAYDMLELQSLTNGLWSTIMTNLRAFGVQNVLLPEGSNISETQLGGQLNVISFDPAGPPPSALQLCAQPNGVFDALNALSGKLETISGVNSTARGNPPPQVGSGVALSMLQSLNVQYSQGLQSSYVSGMEQVGTTLISIIKNYAQVPRTIAIVGQANASYLKQFEGKDLAKVHRVSVKLGNPMSNTPQGRFALGEMLADKGLITDASQLLTVFETGNLDVLTEGRDAQLIFSKQIIEALRNAEPVPEPVITDDHKLMIRALADLSSDMSIRLEHPELLAPIFEQLMKHMKFLQDPSTSIIMGVLGQEALPPPVDQSQGMAQPGAPIDMSSTTNMPNPNGNKMAQAANATGQGKPMPQQPAPPKAPNNVGNLNLKLARPQMPQAGNGGPQ